MNPDHILKNNPGFAGMAMARNDLVVHCEGHSLPLTLVTPAFDPGSADLPAFPLVVFLQGSGWTSPNRYFQLPQLCRYAQQGLAVASITHRDATEGNPFPAYLKDAKAAIRFLRSQANELCLDPDRVAFFGTSSGGNTALMVGLTGDDPRYQTDDYADSSDAVRAVVDCFGPTDLLDFEGNELRNMLGKGLLGKEALAQLAQQEGNGILRSMLGLFGEQEPLEILRAMSPLYEVHDLEAYPPFLLVHGDADPVVPRSQSDKMHQRLKEAGAQSTYAVITGAEHEGTFWSEEVHRLIFNFLRKHLAF